VSLFGALTAASAFAAPAANSSWNNKPSWALSGSENSASSGVSKKSAPKAALRESRGTPTPFAPESNNVALGMGQVFLMGDLGAKYQDNLGLELQYTYGVSEIFGFSANLGHSSHSQGKFSQTTLVSGLRANLSWFDRVIPYASVGLGFYKPSVEFSDLTSASPVVFGVHLGPGVDLQLTDQLYFGAAITFHDMFGTKAIGPNGPVEIGGTYTSFLLHVGASI
jgi:hypothetical protein